MNFFVDFQQRVAALLRRVVAAGALPDTLDLARFVVEPPRDSAHGDLSTNAAMVYAREARRRGSNPRALAARDRRRARRMSRRRAGGSRRARIHQHPFEAGGLRRCAARGAERGARFGARRRRARRGQVNVEYVSANPTGPMHVGHARGAVFGDALANLLAFAGRR